MDRQKVLNSILERFSALGYQTFSSSLTFDRRDVWMRRANDPMRGKFVTTIYLQYKPSFRAYSVAFGVVEDDLAQQLRQILLLPVVQELLKNWKEARLEDSPCWNLFDAGRALNWHWLCIPDPDSPSSWEVELQKFQHTVLDSLAHKVVDDSAYSQFLLRWRKPFEWWTSSSVLRAGQIVLALKRQGYTVEATIALLEAHRAEIEEALGRDTDLVQFVHALTVYATH